MKEALFINIKKAIAYMKDICIASSVCNTIVYGGVLQAYTLKASYEVIYVDRFNILHTTVIESDTYDNAIKKTKHNYHTIEVINIHFIEITEVRCSMLSIL
jgi:hypothetical protein